MKCPRGNSMHLIEWDPGLRAMYSGRPIFDPADVDLRDLHGEPLDTEQSFRLDADRDEMAHFLRTAGFLIAREVFSEQEIAGFVDDAAALRAAATLPFQLLHFINFRKNTFQPSPEILSYADLRI